MFTTVLPRPLKRFLTDRNRWHRWRLGVLARPFYAGLGTILALHRVRPGIPGPRIAANQHLEISPENLDAVLELLRVRGYEFVSMDDVFDMLTGAARKRQFIAVTIDDGYLDTVRYAQPILAKHGVPFTLYVATAFPDRTAVLWWYHLEEWILGAAEVTVEIDGRARTFPCRNADERETAFNELSPLLAQASGEEFDRRLVALLGSNHTEWVRAIDEAALTWDDISAMSRDPLVTIGAHSVDHVALSRLSRDDARAQMLGSKRAIESRLGRTVHHFAYPYGSRWAAGEREFALAGDSGFRTAVTTRSGNIFEQHRRSLRCLPRIELANPNLLDGIALIELWLDGCVPCYENRFRRVITL